MGWKDTIKKDDAPAPKTWQDTIAPDPSVAANQVALQSSPPAAVDNPKAMPKSDYFHSWGRGLLQGVTLGHSDEVLSAGRGLLAAVRDPIQGGQDSGLSRIVRGVDAYKTSLAGERAANEEAYASNPKTYTAANIVGGSIPAVMVAPESAVGGIAAAAAQGGLSGEGYSNKSLVDDSSGVARDAAGGALTGALFQGVGTGVSRALPTAANIRSFSNTMASKAAGAMGSDLKKLTPIERQQMGAAIHDVGLKAFDSLEEIGAKISSAKEDAGQAIGKALNSVDDLVSTAKTQVDQMQWPDAAKQAFKDRLDQNYQFNQSQIADRIEKELIAPNLKNPLIKAERDKLQSIANDFRSNGASTMREGNVIKGTQGKKTNFNSATVPEEFKQELYTIIKEELDNVVGKTGTLENAVAKNASAAKNPLIGEGEPNQPNNPEDIAARNKSVLDNYVAAKKQYGTLSNAERINTARQGSAAGNRVISLTDTIAGVGGLATGGPAAAVVTGALNKAVRKYGDSVAAVATKTAADMFENAPASMGKFYLMFKEAAKNGTGSVAGLNEYLLQNSKDYQNMLKNYQNQGAQ